MGRTAAHTHVSTQNNLYLSELVPENLLWINDKAAGRLGIKDGDYVEVTSPLKTTGRIKAKVTDMIHPEAVFMLHGFGKTVPAQTRCYQKGASDALLQENVSDRWAAVRLMTTPWCRCGRSKVSDQWTVDYCWLLFNRR